MQLAKFSDLKLYASLERYVTEGANGPDLVLD